MKNALLCAGFLLIVNIACKHLEVEPARSIEGTYQAKDYDHSNSPTPYPINGQNINMQIRYVSTDTVSVEITPSTTQGFLIKG